MGRRDNLERCTAHGTRLMGQGSRHNAGVAQKLVYLVPLPGEPVPPTQEARGGLRPHLQNNLFTKDCV